MAAKGGSGRGRGPAARRSFSASPTDYRLLEEVGHGASATVYRALYVPSSVIVAVKCLDLDRCSTNLDDIRREAQTMSLIEHPNVIKAYCSFVVGHNLWVVMPFMADGSCLHLMKVAYPDGFEELVIGSILRETLKALVYLHKHGHIHRDIKAGNILIDSSGVVKLGDFGVSACMFDKSDRQYSRNTLVGTPCWMAPEVLQPGSWHDFKADIWSFGITALELAHGHAPFSKYPPMKVLLMTLQNAPPGLDYERDKRFSKSFKEMVAMCLVKDQTKRPTAEILLKHSFFKNAKPPELCVKSLIADLPPLCDRVKALQLKEKKMASAEQEALSQSEYQRGVSAWNFDIEDLKAQASLDDEGLHEAIEYDESAISFINIKDPAPSSSSAGKSFFCGGSDYVADGNHIDDSKIRSLSTQDDAVEQEVMDSRNQEKASGNERLLKSDSSTSKPCPEAANLMSHAGKKQQTFSGPVMPINPEANSFLDKGLVVGRTEDNKSAVERLKHDVRKGANFSGPLMLPTRASANSLSAPIRFSGGYGEAIEDKSKLNVVQIKGRFSVTSENVDIVKVSSIRKSASVGEWLAHSKQLPSKEVGNLHIQSSLLTPSLQNLFHQTSFQQALLTDLLNCSKQNELIVPLKEGMRLPAHNHENELPAEAVASSERERLLLSKVSELQARMNSLTDEWVEASMKHIQLEKQLQALLTKEDGGRM